MVAKLRQRWALLLLGRRNRRPLLELLLLIGDRPADFLLRPVAIRCHGRRFSVFRGGRQYPFFRKNNL